VGCLPGRGHMNEKTKQRRMEKNLSVTSHGSLDPITSDATLFSTVTLVLVLETKVAMAADSTMAVEARRVEAMMVFAQRLDGQDVLLAGSWRGGEERIKKHTQGRKE